MQQYRANPYASPSANGIGRAGVPAGFRDIAYDYVLPASLLANGTLNAQMGVNTDSDFCWRALVFNSTGVFSVKFSDSDSFELSNSAIISANIQGDPSSPWPILPEIIIPAGGRIGLELLDLSGVDNTLNFLFRGAKRFTLG